MRNLSIHLWRIALIIITATTLQAQSTNYPPADICYTPENTEKGETILTITNPMEVVVMGKWNTVTIRIPGRLNYAPGMVIKGKAKVESSTDPNHLGFSLMCSNGKQGFAKVQVGSDGLVDFEIPLSSFTASLSAKNKDDFTEDDHIKAIRVYSSFSEEVLSTFTLESFALLAPSE